MREWCREPALLPHEAAFAGFLGLTWARLCHGAGLLAPATLTYAALFVAVAMLPIAARALQRRGRQPWPGRVRLFVFAPLMMFVFQDLRRTIPLFHPAHVDQLLQAIDLRWFGTSLPHVLDGRLSRVPTEILSICYSLFFVYLAAALLRWLFAPAAQARAFFAGLFTLYAAGFVGYTVLPALGPYATMDFTSPVEGFAITRLLIATVPFGTNQADAFPSLHCAVTAFILGFDLLTGHRRLAAWCALPVAGLWASTICLRFHYAIDVAAGFALAGSCLALAAILLRPSVRRSAHPLAHPS